MRKVYIGQFEDYRPAETDYDSGLIGANIAARYERNELAKTRGLEYYIRSKER